MKMERQEFQSDNSKQDSHRLHNLKALMACLNGGERRGGGGVEGSRVKLAKNKLILC